MNNQSFHWFEKANKLYYHSLSLIQSNNRVSTIDQPMGVAFII